MPTLQDIFNLFRGKGMNVEDLNMLLGSMVDDETIEPIDEPNCHPLDWADVVGVTNEVFDEIYPNKEI